ncbi:MAG: N-acetyltransferase [Rhodospirillaceae bacterium]|nr:N-acetyltransferase [Rhodospirillaceae bacterium]
MNSEIHETACVNPRAIIGEGTKVWHFCHIMQDAQLGQNCSLGQNVFVAAGVQIGNNVKIQNNVSVYSGVTLEDDVFCGPSMVFTNVKTPRSAHPRNRPSEDYKSTLVKRGATIGANATILSGVTIGEYALIGAGAVVTKDVNPHALILGVPGRQHGWVCECGEILVPTGTTVSCSCRNVYELNADRILEPKS